MPAESARSVDAVLRRTSSLLFLTNPLLLRFSCCGTPTICSMLRYMDELYVFTVCTKQSRIFDLNAKKLEATVSYHCCWAGQMAGESHPMQCSLAAEEEVDRGTFGFFSELGC